MKRIFAIFKKEILRFFTDIRMLLSLIIPGIAIFLIYSLIGDVFSPDKIAQVDKNYIFKIAMSDNYSSLKVKPSKLEISMLSFLNQLEYQEPEITYFDIAAKDSYKEKLVKQELDCVIVYEDNFEDNLYLENNLRPDIDIFYNSESKESEVFFGLANQIVNLTYSNFTVNIDIPNPNLGHDSQIFGQIMGIIFPIITISLIYGISITVCPESIAGEKERGTLSSILLTPIKRSEFAIGKILALVVVCIFGSSISAAGVLLSLPKMLKGQGMNIDIPIYAYVLLGLVFLSLSILFVSCATAISTYAKTTKEATGYLGPLNVVLMILAIAVGFADCSNIGFAFVPILNACQSMNMIVTGNLDIVFLFVTLITNLIYSILMVIIDAKLFSIERIVMRQ